jgi:SAM-dependent methyltransferase
MNATEDYPIDWHDPARAAGLRQPIPCPVCGSDCGKTAVLTTPSVADPQRRRLVTFLRCDACSSLFAEDRVPFEYELELSSWAGEYYLEQGAGLDSMIEAVLHLPPEPKRAMLEIGCGFGFALHFARQQRGWIVRGIDPSPIAAEGGRLLGLDIRSAYLTATSDWEDVYDVILASEVVEHLPLPGSVLRNLHACLSPAGVLVLTTPDAACVNPATDLGTLIPALSPGYHLTLYSAAGLEHELRTAGFAFVKIARRRGALAAWASQQPLCLRPPTKDDRAAYENWLAAAADDPTLPASLGGGMACRLLKARVHAGTMTTARDLFAKIAASCRQRFGLDLSEPPRLSAETSREMLGSTPRRIPYYLPGLLYCRGMIEMSGNSPGEGAGWFDVAEQVARGCCAFYRGHGVDDGETADLVGISARLSLLALCHRDPAAVAGRLTERTEMAPEVATELTLRLLDLGHLEAASAIAEHARSALLSALTEGYIALIRSNDPTSALVAFRTAESLTTGPSPSLAERLLFGLVVSAAHDDPAAAVARLLAAPAASDRILRSLLVRLADLGHLAEAASLEPLAGHLADDWQVLNARAMIALNHRRDGAAAAALFATAFASADAAGVEGEALWRVKYHEAFAWKTIGRLAPAQAAARMLIDPPPHLPPAPAAIRDRLRALELFGESDMRAP